MGWGLSHVYYIYQIKLLIETKPIVCLPWEILHSNPGSGSSFSLEILYYIYIFISYIFNICYIQEHLTPSTSICIFQ